MSTNWSKLQQIKRIEDTANKLGFELTAGRDTWHSDGGNLIYLMPLDDNFPHYSRGAEIFQGTIEDIDIWLNGLKWAREYDEILKLSTDKKRAEREQIERNRQLLKMVKIGKKVDGAYTGSFEDDEEYTIWVDPQLNTDDDIPF